LDFRNFRISIPALPFCKFTLTAPKPTKISQNPQTWGEHIKKRRLELGLFQSAVAKIIGITTSTVTNWEKYHSEPMLWVIPKVIEFLGYIPDLQSIQSLGQRIKAYRLLLGITQEELSRKLKVDPTTLGRWERNESQPSGKVINLLFNLNV
jgi:transcriptional regulator with XRE-family HTH domain